MLARLRRKVYVCGMRVCEGSVHTPCLDVATVGYLLVAFDSRES